jgi:hypothetical protein
MIYYNTKSVAAFFLPSDQYFSQHMNTENVLHDLLQCIMFSAKHLLPVLILQQKNDHHKCGDHFLFYFAIIAFLNLSISGVSL